MTETLKACPCCGNTDIDHVPGEHICCRKVSCGVRVEMDAPWGGQAKDGVAFLVAAWNTRPQPTEKPLTREEFRNAVRVTVHAWADKPPGKIDDWDAEKDELADSILALFTLAKVDAEVVERLRNKADELTQFAALRDVACTEKAFHERAHAGLFADDIRAILAALTPK
jgi:hypothetical protein